MRIFKNGERMMKNNIVKIIMWILFWFYLIPYYLIKKLVFKKNKHQVFWANCVTIALFVLLSLAVSPSSTTTTSSNEDALAKSSRVVHKTVTKKVGTKELNKEKKAERYQHLKKRIKERWANVMKMLRWIFPDYRYMASIYSVLDKVPILLPVYWIVRDMRLLGRLLKK